MHRRPSRRRNLRRAADTQLEYETLLLRELLQRNELVIRRWNGESYCVELLDRFGRRVLTRFGGTLGRALGSIMDTLDEFGEI